MRVSMTAIAALAALGLGPAVKAEPASPRTAATYIADCKSADPDRQGLCDATFVVVLAKDLPSSRGGYGPGAICPPEGSLKHLPGLAADWLKARPELADMIRSESVNLAARTLWPCKR